MDTIWNEVDLKIPPLITLRVTDVHFVKKVRSVFLKRNSPKNKILQDELANSAALLSRLMARRKNSFHNMSGFKFVCKLNTALSRLLKVDVEQVINNFFQMLPDVFTNSLPHNEVPSRSSFDYTLLRIISVHKLYQRISYCCTESADYFNKLLRNNFFVDTITLFLAVIARLWDLSNKLGNAYSDTYRKLNTFRKCFPPMDANNHFENFQFPDQLDRFSMPNIDDGASDLNKEKTRIIASQTITMSAVSVIPKIQKSEDIGTAISRDSLRPVIDVSRIHNVDDIRRFFKEEDEHRKKSLSSCSTKHILKHEWLGIQKLVERKIIANNHKKALSIFRKFITSKT